MRRLFGTIFSLENLGQLTLFFVGGMVILSLAAPELIPQIERGPTCINLPNPPGGNQRSLLALKDDNQSLGVEVSIANPESEDGVSIRFGDPLELRVVLKNEDNGPIYLFFNDDFMPPIGSEDNITSRNVIGVFFEITAAVNSNQFFTDSSPNAQGFTPNLLDNGSFELSDIYVLQAKRSCNMIYEISPERLQGMGLGPGDYRVQAFYFNQNTVGEFIYEPDRATATPILDAQQRAEIGQGVWTGLASSDELRFSVLQPSQ